MAPFVDREYNQAFVVDWRQPRDGHYIPAAFRSSCREQTDGVGVKKPCQQICLTNCHHRVRKTHVRRHWHRRCAQRWLHEEIAEGVVAL